MKEREEAAGIEARRASLRPTGSFLNALDGYSKIVLNDRTNRTTKGTTKFGQSLVVRKAKLVAVVVVVLLVGVSAVVLIQGQIPSTARSSKPYTLDYLLWTAEGDQPDARFGRSLSSAGDVNNDGYDDIVIGSHIYDNGETNEGRAFLYLGSSTGPLATPSWTAESNQAHSLFGKSVSSAGDVNNDGYDDVVVGARSYASGQQWEGRAYLYLGSSTGLLATASWTAESDQAGAYLGWSVSDAGDVNNDDYDDVVVGAPCFTNTQNREGCAYLYLGTPSGLSAVPSWTAYGYQIYAWFGKSVSSAGDVNNDGYDDVIVGAYLIDNGEVDEGMAVLYLGSSGGLSTMAAWFAEGDQAYAHFGYSVSSAGDVNNDGFDDVVVGACDYDSGGLNGGRACLYLGSSTGLSASPTWVTEIDQVNASYGFSVSSAGDVNNDGFDDVVVGAPYCDNDQENEGLALLYLGSPTGLSESFSWYAEGNQVNASCGYCVSGAGDVNGDGHDEVLVGAETYDDDQMDEGRALLYGELALIPEFNIMLIPVMGAAAVVVALHRVRTRNGDRR